MTQSPLTNPHIETLQRMRSLFTSRIASSRDIMERHADNAGLYNQAQYALTYAETNLAALDAAVRAIELAEKLNAKPANLLAAIMSQHPFKERQNGSN